MISKAVLLSVFILCCCGSAFSLNNKFFSNKDIEHKILNNKLPNNSTVQVLLQFGDNIAPVVSSFVTELITNATTSSNIQLRVIDSNFYSSNGNASFTYYFVFGNAPLRNKLITQQDLDKAGSEGFIVRSQTYSNVSTTISAVQELTAQETFYVGDGNMPMPDTFSLGVYIGAHYATFRYLTLMRCPL